MNVTTPSDAHTRSIQRIVIAGDRLVEGRSNLGATTEGERGCSEEQITSLHRERMRVGILPVNVIPYGVSQKLRADGTHSLGQVANKCDDFFI